MMKSKRSLKSSVKLALKTLPLILFLAACNSSVPPSFLKEDITPAVKDICKKEYKLDVSTRLIGSTLWVYMPLENILSRPEKPEKYLERFLLEDQKNSLQDRILKINYSVRPTPEKEKTQEMALDKSVNEKIFDVLQVIRRVLFSLGSSKKDAPAFFYIVTADIHNGFEIKQLFYVLDLKKLSYNFISQSEYQHRIVQDTGISADILGDREGNHLNYQEVTLEDFLAQQIQNRIKMKFQKPEVAANADIDKEVLKLITYTLEAYDFKDLELLELSNLATGVNVTLNQAAIFANSPGKKK
jgi:hypothetical protein